ncbi:unnamed protein product [Effrenium voratum]|uniref:Uncharacterized protein n=1 Tax=Effrenium voratum TaxID=2562239 RepID=A0AA36JQQ2_9DINO|nr:unnamed protein product [Effrenium voratum]
MSAEVCSFGILATVVVTIFIQTKCVTDRRERATVANGIAEGWASRAAKEGTSFSQGEYRLRNFLAVILSRFLGPIVGRLAVDFGGRNVYASLQFILCLLGTRTVYKVCRLLWLPVKGPGPGGWLHQLSHSPRGDHCGTTSTWLTRAADARLQAAGLNELHYGIRQKQGSWLKWQKLAEVPLDTNCEDLEFNHLQKMISDSINNSEAEEEHGARSAGLSLGAPEPNRRMADIRAAAERRLQGGARREAPQEILQEEMPVFRDAEKPRQTDIRAIAERRAGGMRLGRTPGSPRATTPRGSATRTPTPRGGFYKPNHVYSSRAEGR